MKEFLKEQGMFIQAWYPLGHGDAGLLNEPVFAKLGENIKIFRTDYSALAYSGRKYCNSWF